MENDPITNNKPAFFTRVVGNDAARKGLAGAVAGVLVAVVCELIWPSEK